MTPRASERQYGAKKPGKCRHNINTAIILHLSSQILHFGRFRNQAQIVPKPLDQSASDGDGTFKGIDRIVTPSLICHRGNETVFGCDGIISVCLGAESNPYRKCF